MASLRESRRLRELARARFTKPEGPRGFLVAFEGPDGSGKFSDLLSFLHLKRLTTI